MNKILNFQSELLQKIQLTEDTFELHYRVPAEFIFTPGQFVGARVIPTHTRAYSIVEVNKDILKLLIDVKPQGIASKYFEKVNVGEFTNLLGPYGVYKVKDSNFNKVFISTGTGIAPFVGMIKQAIKLNPSVEIYNFFGSQVMAHDIAYKFFEKDLGKNFHYINCITREDISTLNPQSQYQKITFGRVTKIVPEYNFDPSVTEFYICGNHLMVSEMAEILKASGADKIYLEKY